VTVKFWKRAPKPESAALALPADVVSLPPVHTPPAELIKPHIPFYLPIVSTIGLICIVMAQAWLLISRQPIIPLVLVLVGLVLLRPLLAFYGAHPALWPSSWVNRDDGQPFRLPRLRLRHFRQRFAQTTVVLLALMITAIALQVLTPAPAALPEQRARVEAPTIVPENSDIGPLYHAVETLFLTVSGFSVTNLRYLSILFALLTIPAVYAFARAIDSQVTGYYATGFAAVCGWMLALSRSLDVYSALALMSALYLTALYRAIRSGRRSSYAVAGLLLGVGWLVTPLFFYMSLIVPLAALFVWLDKRATRRDALTNAAIALLIASVIVLPFALTRGSLLPTMPSGTLSPPLSPLWTTLDALANSLLMFNLTSDPSPLHGLVNRPAFAPTMAALFLIGVFAWAWRLHGGKRWLDALLPCALLIALLPSAVNIAPPISYPNVYRAAAAFPIGLALVAISVSLLAKVWTARYTRLSRAVFAGVFIYLLIATATDAQHHYISDFIPAYQRAAPVYNELSP